MNSPQLTGLPQEPSAELIEWLETALESARVGDLQHVAAVGVYRGREVVTSWTPNINSVIATTLGGLRLLEHELLDKIRREDTGMRNA